MATTLRRGGRVLQGQEFIAQNAILPVPSRSGFLSALIQGLDDTPHLRAFPNFIEGEAQTRLELFLVSFAVGQKLVEVADDAALKDTVVAAVRT